MSSSCISVWTVNYVEKIPFEHLKPGMYVHDLGTHWLSHLFLQQQFSVSNESDLHKIVSAGIRELYIDTSKGLDVADAPSPLRSGSKFTNVWRSSANRRLTSGGTRLPRPPEPPWQKNCQTRKKSMAKHIALNKRLGGGRSTGYELED
ncbi:MAG: DUF3391 domain-containing protein [Burkholderiales bacterium]